MLNPTCPIHQDKIHCSTCYFAPNRVCEHARIMRERQQVAHRIESGYAENASDKLTERHK